MNQVNIGRRVLWRMHRAQSTYTQTHTQAKPLFQNQVIVYQVLSGLSNPSPRVCTWSPKVNDDDGMMSVKGRTKRSNDVRRLMQSV